MLHPYNYPIGNGNNVINTAYKEITAIEADCTISNSSVDGVKELIKDNKINFQADNGCISGLNGWNNLFNSNLGSLEVTDLGSDKYTIRYTISGESISISPNSDYSVQFQIQDNSIKVTELRIFGEAGEGSGSGGSGKNIQDILCQNISNKNETISLTFYYATGNSETIDTTFNADDRINTGSLNKSNVVGVKIVGKDGLSFQATVRESDSVPAFGGWWEDVSGTTPKTFGECNDSVSEPTQPSTDPSEEEPESDLLDLVIADDGTIKIPNQKPGTNISIIAEKIWADDTGFESLRPEEISVTLKRKLPDGSGDNSFDEHTATLNAANQWKATWSGLPRLVDENGGDVESNQYKYYVDEINAPTNYRVEYSENNEGLSANGTITITNTLKTKKNLPMFPARLWFLNHLIIREHLKSSLKTRIIR